MILKNPAIYIILENDTKETIANNILPLLPGRTGKMLQGRFFERKKKKSGAWEAMWIFCRIFVGQISNQKRCNNFKVSSHFLVGGWISTPSEKYATVKVGSYVHLPQGSGWK